MIQRVIHDDCLEFLPFLRENLFTAVVTDPPYGLEFMGKEWDRLGGRMRAYAERSGYKDKGILPGYGRGGLPKERAKFCARSNLAAQEWHYRWAQQVLRVLKPGGHLLAFGGRRTFHRLTCALEDAGWEIRDCLMWVYGQGFPKSTDVSKQIDKAAGAEREVVGQKWAERYPNGPGGVGFHGGPGEYRQIGRGPEMLTAPATELAELWNGWGTALKPAWEPIILARKPPDGTVAQNAIKWGVAGLNIDGCLVPRIPTPGWPANLIHDGSGEILEIFPQAKNGSAARFFYCAKASKKERTCDGNVPNKHPTVKPLALMEYLVKLLAYPGENYVLDPFCGSGSTLIACKKLGHHFLGIDSDPESVRTARARLQHT